MKAYKSTKKIFLGLSGGVDSAVTLALLAKKHGAENIQAIFMRNWSKDLPGFQCPWQEDWHDAQSVALTLGVKVELWDFENDYKDKVVDYLISEYKAGRTPNPDIICNQEVKFKVFLEQAIQEGAAKIATGHYARITDDPISPHIKWLKIAKDKTKDQSYFLARISQKALQKTIFPLGELQKKEVRELATKFNLPVATKKDSVGICFVGEVGIVDFLKNFIGVRPGAIIDIKTNQRIGTHQGSELYTIGQRHGLNLSSSQDLPYYVTSKNITKNTIYVTSDISATEVWIDQVKLTDCHFISIHPDDISDYSSLSLRTRHLGKLEAIQKIELGSNNSEITINLRLKSKIKTPAPGQSGVVYTEDGRVLFSGFIF